MTFLSMIVFSDLDGTLLDHDTYDHSPALPALKRLAELNIPVILASSKTAAEIGPIRETMQLSHYPAIVENGAGVLPAQTQAEVDTSEYDQIREALGNIPADLRRGFTGFGDMTVDQVAGSTGLPMDQAALAKTRAFSEPGLWSGDDTTRESFQKALQTLGVHSRYGGRYLTLSLGRNKADRMAEIASAYTRTTLVALGDAPNDLEMLLAAHHPFLIKNPHAKPLPPLPKNDADRIIRSTKTGPSGWNEVMLPLLSG